MLLNSHLLIKYALAISCWKTDVVLVKMGLFSLNQPSRSVQSKICNIFPSVWTGAKQIQSNRIGRIVWSTQFFLCSQNLIRPPPYYAAWGHPWQIILSAFLFVTKLKVWQINSTKVCHKVQFFLACLAPLKPYNLVYFL